MKLTFTSLLLLLSLASCKKEKLDGDYSILQGKWEYIGSEETRENKTSGVKTYSFIPASGLSDLFHLEFERKGVLSVWRNNTEEKFYRIQTVLSRDGCTSVSNCQQRGLYLNFNQDKQFTAFMNEDTMYTGDEHLNIPYIDYQDQAYKYRYLHVYVRIN